MQKDSRLSKFALKNTVDSTVFIYLLFHLSLKSICIKFILFGVNVLKNVSNFIDGFFKYPDERPPLERAIYADNQDETIGLIKSKAFNVNKSDDRFGKNLLYRNVLNQRYKVVVCLINHGANPEIRTRDRWHQSPLEVATICRGDLNTFRFLVMNGANFIFDEIKTKVIESKRKDSALFFNKNHELFVKIASKKSSLDSILQKAKELETENRFHESAQTHLTAAKVWLKLGEKENIDEYKTHYYEHSFSELKKCEGNIQKLNLYKQFDTMVEVNPFVLEVFETLALVYRKLGNDDASTYYSTLFIEKTELQEEIIIGNSQESETSSLINNK
jgi:hypothetical protein